MPRRGSESRSLPRATSYWAGKGTRCGMCHCVDIFFVCGGGFVATRCSLLAWGGVSPATIDMMLDGAAWQIVLGGHAFDPTLGGFGSRGSKGFAGPTMCGTCPCCDSFPTSAFFSTGSPRAPGCIVRMRGAS